MTYSRRGLIAMAGAGALAAQSRRFANWKPRLGVLMQYSSANLDWVKQQGFTSLQLTGGPGLEPGKTDDRTLQEVKARISPLYASSLGANGNHIASDPGLRQRVNTETLGAIEIAGKLGIPYIGTQSGTLPGRPLREQVDEIVRVYTEKYFPACQKYNVKILWEPWQGGPNIATGPVGWEALFKAFGDSPHIGLQFDPSHLAWQMMDPIDAARQWITKIYDVHLKDAEILWHVVRRGGIVPVNNARWWRFRLPGYGIVDWKGFFTVLAEAGYSGAMNIENEDEFYYPPYSGSDFTPQFKRGFELAHAFLKTLVPPVS